MLHPVAAARVVERRTVPFARTVITQDAQAAVQDVLSSGWVTTGHQALAFEGELAAYVGARRGVAVSSCTAAIELALRALDLPPGAPVLTTADTFCGAAGAILHAGLIPALVDVDPVSAAPTPDTIQRAVAGLRGELGLRRAPAAMVVMHLGGNPVDVDAAALAAGLPTDLVIEDAAHALGTEVHGRRVGSLSRATCFSFYATKNLAIGEGGMITTDDDDLADRLISSRLHGMSKDAWRRYLPGGGWRYDVASEGLKANLTDVQAAIGRAHLRGFDAAQARREELAARYDQLLAGLAGITLPPRSPLGRHAWHLYAVRVEDTFPLSRDEVIDDLAARGIGTSVHFIPLHRLAWHAQSSIIPQGGLPGADAVFERTLSLPLDQNMTDSDVDAVCEALWDLGREDDA